MEFIEILFGRLPNPLPYYEFKITKKSGNCPHKQCEADSADRINITMERNKNYDGALEMYGDPSNNSWIVDRIIAFGLKDAHKKEEAECRLLVSAILVAQAKQSKKLIYYTRPDRIEDIESMGAECSYPAEFNNKKCARCEFDLTKEIFKY